VARDDLVEALRLLYRAAGQPSFRKISSEIRERTDMPDSVSHETVSGLLSGATIPKWTKVESVVRQLVDMDPHHPDADIVVQRFLGLWTATGDTRSNNLAATAYPTLPEPRSPSPESLVTAEPQSGTVPPRHPRFTGREDLLQVMRTRLEADPWQPLILHGLSGVGKTSIAVEYVHRATDRYRVVWWIVAEQIARARTGLVALAERLDLEVSQQDMRQAVSSVLGKLEDADFNWLIVFDNAGGPEEIRDLLPTGRGHVIVTTRDGTWVRYGNTVTVDVLSREDSIDLLQRRSAISFDDADRLADRLGDLPLALEQASAMRSATGTSVSEFLRQLDAHATSVLDQGRPSDYPETVATAFGLAFDQVKRESFGAAQLQGMLSCLSAEPVSLALLRSADEGAIAQPLGRLLRQEAQLEAAVRLLQRFGLLTTVDYGQKLQVHRLVQLIVRESLSDQDRDRAYRNARRLLVAADPGWADEPLTWEMHAQIGPHIGPAELLADRDPPVRTVVLNHARYLYVRGDFDGSLRLSAEARAAWAGPDDVWDDDETFACIDHHALSLVGLGRYQDANALYDEAWIRVNTHERFGESHNRTVRIANGVAQVSRILGNYGKALNLERYRVDHYEAKEELDHPDLLRARGNLAVTYRMTGEFEDAREIDESLVAHWRRTHGENDYRTQFALSNLVRDLYGLGLYADALRIQQESLSAMAARLGSRHLYVLLAGRTVAIALRKLGRLTEALEQSRINFFACQGEWGSDHGHTLAAAITYANTIRAAVATGVGGSLTYSHAYNTSLQAVNIYRTRFGERNPLTLAAATNHAITLRAIGERHSARSTDESAYHLLNDQLGTAHPYTQAAAVGLANDLIAAHDEINAARLLQETLDSAGTANRLTHPDMLICAMNLGLITRSWDKEGGEALVDRNLHALRAALDPSHPHVVAASRGERGECDIEPPPF
jgi:tetratricopeptide (TPR) repeat protein